MSRFAEASARAGRAVPDNPRVDWTKEREAAERLLRGAAAEHAAPPPPAPPAAAPPAPALAPLAVASPPALDSVEPAFSWPVDFDLDEIDLSRDPHARDFRRPRPITRRRVDVDDQSPLRHSQRHHESAASPPSPRVSGHAMPPRQNAASSQRGTHGNLGRAEASLGIPRWVVITVGLIVLLASAALLTYFLRHRDVAGGPPYVHPFEFAWRVPNYIDMVVSPSETEAGKRVATGNLRSPVESEM